MTIPPLRPSARRRLLSKNAHYVISGTFCFVAFFCHYWKWIVVTSNTIFESSSIIGVEDSHSGNIVKVRENIYAKYGNDTASSGNTPLQKHHTNDTSISLPITSTNDTDIELETNTNDNSSDEEIKVTTTNSTNDNLSFYILPSPDITTLQRYINKTKSDLLAMASDYYQTALNEESAEMWLHRGFERLPFHVKNPREADVYIVPGYCHLFHGLLSKENSRQAKSWASMIPKLYRNIVINPSKPHLILTPTWNPETSRKIGLHSIVTTLKLGGVSHSNIWSVGFERNPSWQPVPHVSQILPIPYVVRMKQEAETDKDLKESRQDSSRLEGNQTRQKLIPRQDRHRSTGVENSTNTVRMENSIFFAGDPRKNAKKWAGCSRSEIIDALETKLTSDDAIANLDLRLLNKRNRLNQTTYQERMRTSEYCLVLCGDTPSSRTLTAAVVERCIPIRVGSRLRGLCDPPCHEGFGWKVTGPENPHLPFGDRIPWDSFPEIDEAALLSIGGGDSGGKESKNDSSLFLQSMFQSYDAPKKERLHTIMDRVRPGFIYGYGDPVLSEDFGDAALYIWESFVAALKKKAKNK